MADTHFLPSKIFLKTFENFDRFEICIFPIITGIQQM